MNAKSIAGWTSGSPLPCPCSRHLSLYVSFMNARPHDIYSSSQWSLVSGLKVNSAAGNAHWGLGVRGAQCVVFPVTVRPCAKRTDSQRLTTQAARVSLLELERQHTHTATRVVTWNILLKVKMPLFPVGGNAKGLKKTQLLKHKTILKCSIHNNLSFFWENPL